MRLWHIELLNVLPRQQLLGQWRECHAMMKDYISKWKGIPKKSGGYATDHPLVAYISNYHISHFIRYVRAVAHELTELNYNIKWAKFERFLEDLKALDIDIHIIAKSLVFYKHHNLEYLVICYYNLKEKYIRGIIEEKDFKSIRSKIYRLTGGFCQ